MKNFFRLFLTTFYSIPNGFTVQMSTPLYKKEENPHPSLYAQVSLFLHEPIPLPSSYTFILLHSSYQSIPALFLQINYIPFCIQINFTHFFKGFNSSPFFIQIHYTSFFLSINSSFFIQIKEDSNHTTCPQQVYLKTTKVIK